MAPYLTPAAQFRDVSRGNPKPFTLEGDALIAARLTPETWRLEIAADDSSSVAKPLRIEGGTALDLPALLELGKTRGVKILKGMQCLNIAQPLGYGLWEGVLLRDVLALAGKLDNVRRINYWGFHNNDPQQIFRSTLSYTEALETAPGELPPIVAYRLNGEPISLVRGGPVRMMVPWAHGFKSVKWLQRIEVTNNYQATDTYHSGNNDVESHLKSPAYLLESPTKFAVNKPVVIRGTAIAGLSGIERIECWVRPDTGMHGTLADDDPAWKTAQWQPCTLDQPPEDWGAALPAGVAPREILGFDDTGRPKIWPLRYSTVGWTATLQGLKPGMYELRVRAVDLNGFAQPEPRPYQKSGKNAVPVRMFEVTG